MLPERSATLPPRTPVMKKACMGTTRNLTLQFLSASSEKTRTGHEPLVGTKQRLTNGQTGGENIHVPVKRE